MKFQTQGLWRGNIQTIVEKVVNILECANHMSHTTAEDQKQKHQQEKNECSRDSVQLSY